MVTAPKPRPGSCSGSDNARYLYRARSGLVIIATEDHLTGGEALARRTAERAGAQMGILEGLGHWWMCQDPKQGAEMIRAFVATLA